MKASSLLCKLHHHAFIKELVDAHILMHSLSTPCFYHKLVPKMLSRFIGEQYFCQEDHQATKKKNKRGYRNGSLMEANSREVVNQTEVVGKEADLAAVERMREMEIEMVSLRKRMESLGEREKRQRLCGIETSGEGKKNLFGFNGMMTEPIREIDLPVYAGPITINATVVVVDSTSQCNMILGCKRIHAMKDVSSTYYYQIRG
ncbi:hypothetical protein IFM89_000440 [Coptis chinensis]|uniref:Uncharacterized protein n=1 Tax=Coptis chinensis TaxID=261450 RepID=A0A835LY28_9MAGN|nr:hypothetical protein IFM89_000440 [Coptis chinensis]